MSAQSPLPMKTALRRWGLANLIWWPLYIAAMFWVFNGARAHPDFANWPLLNKVGVAMVPVAPLLIWLFMLGRFIDRSPDELGRFIALRATAKAGLGTAIALFAHGLASIVLTMPLTIIVNGYNFTSLAFAGLFLVIFLFEMAAENLKSIV